MKTVKIQLEELSCPSCITKIEDVLSKEHGIAAAQVLFNSSKVKVQYKEDEVNPQRIKNVIERMGFPIKTAKKNHV